MPRSRNRLRAVTVAAVVCLASLTASSAAVAESSGGLTPPANVQGNTRSDCYQATYQHAVVLDPDVAHWTLQTTMTRPDGSVEGVGYFYEADPTTGADTETLCPAADPYGRYVITGTLTTQDVLFNTLQVVTLAPVTFSYLAPATSRTMVTVAKKAHLYAGHAVLLKVRLLRAGKAWADHPVVVQVKKHGEWTKVAHGISGAHGKVVVTLKAKKMLLAYGAGRALRFRAVTATTSYTYGDASKVKKLLVG